MGARRRATRDVVLVEDDADAGADSMPESSAPGGALPGDLARPERRHRLRWVLAVTLLVLLGTSFAAGQDRERQRLLALAQTRGFVAPLDTPLHEIWRTGTEIDFAGVVHHFARPRRSPKKGPPRGPGWGMQTDQKTMIVTVAATPLVS